MGAVIIPFPLSRRRHPGTWPPPQRYYDTREQLGIPSHADALLSFCPWCCAGIGQSCVVRATGRRTKQPHEARLIAAGIIEAPPTAAAGITP